MDIVDTQVHFSQIGPLDAGLAAMAAVGVQSLLFDDFSGKYDEKNRPLPWSARWGFSDRSGSCGAATSQ